MLTGAALILAANISVLVGACRAALGSVLLKRCVCGAFAVTRDDVEFFTVF